MPRHYRSVIVVPTGETNGFTILSPDVGVYYRAPEIGAYVKTGTQAGLLKRLNSLYHLRMPEDVAGFVTSVAASNIANNVQFKQPLFSIVPAGQAEDLGIADLKGETERERIVDAAAPAGTFAVKSPTDGIFYRRPSPDAAAYVEEGDVIGNGHVLGLVEVMKSFNQIRFLGPEYPPKAKVLKIHIGDESEIRSGQVIFWLQQID